jgi:cation:H+ antiporter
MGYWFLGAGFVLLAVGSDSSVRGGVAVARGIGIAPLAIGIFVVAVSGSAPELAVALQGGFANAPDIALGNVVGSNTINLLLILGLAALIRPLATSPKVVVRDGGSMLGASLVLTLLAWGQAITRAAGVLLLTGFGGYLVALYLTDRGAPTKQSVPSAIAKVQLVRNKTSNFAGGAILLFGLACLVLGAHFTVDGAITLSSALNLSQAPLGLIVVALGTSLPQLLAVVTAVSRGQTDFAIGSLIAANAINILGVIGLAGLFRPLAVAPMIAGVGVLTMFATAALLLPMLAIKWRLSRVQGALLLACYAGYLIFLVLH